MLGSTFDLFKYHGQLQQLYILQEFQIDPREKGSILPHPFAKLSKIISFYKKIDSARKQDDSMQNTQLI